MQAIDRRIRLDCLVGPSNGFGSGSASAPCWPLERFTKTLCETRTRTKVGIVVETGEAREVHHHCCLFGYGADAIYPYLAFDALFQANQGQDDWITDGMNRKSLTRIEPASAKGCSKYWPKMGISTLQSYKGAQIFEAIGPEL